MAPNILDVDYPELIKTVFSTKGDWKKVSSFSAATQCHGALLMASQTEFYHPSSALVGGHIVYNLFSERDVDVHAAQKKPIAKFYSPNGVAPLEPLVDQMIDYLCAQLDKRFATGKPAGKAFNLGDWTLYCTSPVFSSSLAASLTLVPRSRLGRRGHRHIQPTHWIPRKGHRL